MRVYWVIGSLVAGLLAFPPIPALAQTAPLTAPAPNNGADGETFTLAPLQIIGVSPVMGSGIDRDKVPANVRSFSARDIQSVDAPSFIGLLDQRLGSISLNNEQGTPFQPDVEYRGFDASPIAGSPQGIAVYQNGVRINEAFGDTVNWDLVPDFAVNGVDLVSANPVFGLNALGGAISLQMKNGFNAQGFHAELTGGSFGRAESTAEYGVQIGHVAGYIGASGLFEEGFRDHSPVSIHQLYADLGAEKEGLSLHLSFAGADNLINAIGPTPVQLLDQNRSAVFTIPQSMANRLGFLTLTGSYEASDTLNLDSNLYYRRFNQHLTDGNTTSVAACALNPGELCIGDNPLLNGKGLPVPNSFAPGTVLGEIDRTVTTTDGFGGSLQATLTEPLFAHDNHFVAGASLDQGNTNYRATGELGTINSQLYVNGTGIIITDLAGDLAPANLDTANTYIGLYATDTFDITDRLSLTVSGRYNLAFITLTDLSGTGLSGDHRYDRFNPAAGLTYKLNANLTAYAGYSEANRIPTAGELACADPAHPCVLDAFLVSDPNLKQVVARTYEAGLRGNFTIPALAGNAAWNLGVFRTDSQDDIINIASPLVAGLGYFQNAGTTRRQGIEAGIRFKSENWFLFADYALVDATFQSNLTIGSPNNPAADVNGNIEVRPGDHLPSIPEHRLKLGADYSLTKDWKIGTNVTLVSGQYYAGDQSNQNPPIPGYVVASLHSSYRLGEHFELFGHIDNVFDAKYSTFGVFTETGPVSPTLTITNPHSLSPAAPIAVFVGLKASY